MNERQFALILIFLLITSSHPPSTLDSPREDAESYPKTSVLDVLMLGNSYTSQNNLASKLDNILSEVEGDAEVSALTSGGLKLYEHEDRARESGNQWNIALDQSNDFVILQDQSQVPSFPTNSQNWQDSRDAAIYLNQRALDSGGSTILFMTWGYKDGDLNNQWRSPDYPSMQLHLQQGYEMYLENISTQTEPAFIAPVGLAYKHLYDAVADTGVDPSVGSTAFSTLYSSDGSHPSIDGTYLSACVFTAVITGESPVGRTHPGQISPVRALELQEAAAATVFNITDYLYPFEIQPLGIEFGPDSGSIFDIDPGATIGLNFNFTNHAEVDDDAIVSIDGPEGWSIEWLNFEPPGVGHTYNAPPDTPQWVQCSLTAPQVSDGYPLAGSLHSFSMQLISESDGSKDWYNFSLEYGFFHAATIDEGGGNASLSPGDVIDLFVTARNLGNSVRDLVVEIAEVDSGGSLIGESAMSFSSDGWAAIVLSRAQLDSMAPNESGQIRLQVQAPDRYPGALFFDVMVWSSASPDQVSTVNQRVSIVPRTGGVLALQEDGCTGDTSPGETCHGSLRIENTGDVSSTFELIAVNTPEWLTVEFGQSSVTLGPGQSLNSIQISCTVSQGTVADLTAEFLVQLWLGDWSPHELQLTITVGEYYDWLLERASSDLSETNVLTSQWTLTNAGNEPDGLVVNLDVNMVMEFGLVPPLGASTGTESSNPRSFEIMNIEPADSVEFSAWMAVPTEAPIETTATLTVEVRSIRDPSIIFSAEDSVIVPAAFEPGKDEDRNEFLQNFINWLEVWHELFLIAIVVIVGCIGVVVAVKTRKQRELALMSPAPLAKEEAEEWMARFEEGGEQVPELVESPQIGVRDFAAEFIEKSGGLSEKPREGPSKEVVETASDVLDMYQTEHDIESATEMADRMTQGEVPHPDNVMLDPAEQETRKVVPKKRRDDDSPADYDLEL